MPTAAALVQTGIEFQSQGDLEAARLHYLAALKLDSNCVQAIANLCVVLAETNRLEGAAALAWKLVDLVPFNGNFWELLGNFLTRLERLDLAEYAFDQAIGLSPESPSIHHNLALCLLRQRKYQQSIAAFERAEKLGSRGHGIKNDKAHAFMALGNLKQGWELYESRWDTLVHLPPWDYHIPEWKGENLTATRILIHGEQGLGDTIMCSRFFRDLADWDWADVTLGVPRTLQNLFSAQDWNLNILPIEDMNEENMKGFDYQSPMYSAMRYLEIDSPKDVSSKAYLKVPEPRKFESDFNIGLCWASGRRGTEMDARRREADLKLFLPLIENPKFKIWSLQKGTNEEDISNLGLEGLVSDETGMFSDFYETAKFISGLDLVLTVDTAVAHLSGALGIPTFMLAQFSNCWRWWNIENGSGEPWYSGMRIFRQSVPGDWKGPVTAAINQINLGLVQRKIAA